MQPRIESEQSSRSGLAVAVLSIGALGALALGLGGIWWARTGIAIAGLAGLASLALMLRVVRTVEVEKQDAVEQIRDGAHTEAAQAERRHHLESMGIIERFTTRVAGLRAELDQSVAEANDLREQLAARDRLVASMRSTQEVLLDNAVELRARLAGLEQRIAVRELELRSALDQLATIDQPQAQQAAAVDLPEDQAAQTQGEIVHLPRRPQLSAGRTDGEIVIWQRAVGH